MVLKIAILGAFLLAAAQWLTGDGGKLFDAADQVFDCENIYAQAKALA